MSNSRRRCALHDRLPGRFARFEPLEDRRLLAITVSTLSDLVDGNITPGNYSLREAIANAVSGETINFSVAGTINLTAGQLDVGKSLTINGPGAGALTINGQNASRIFDVQAGPYVVDIGGLTLTAGRAAAGQNGGAIRSLSSGLLLIHDCTITANAAGGGGTVTGGSGGGVFSGGPQSIAASTISNNSAGIGGVSANGNFGLNGGSGGGVWCSSTLSIDRSVIADNKSGIGGDGGLSQGFAGDGGGVFISASGSASITASTLSANISFRRGGGVSSSGAVTAVNTTVSGNAAADAGGGLFVGAGTASLKHATVTANVASNGGRGVANAGASSVGIFNSIVAGNTGGSILTSGDVLGMVGPLFSLVGDSMGGIFTTDPGPGGGNLVGLHSSPIDPLLGPLANNGGPTRTHALKPLSPAVNAGDPLLVAGAPGVPAFDQRGTPFSRVTAGRIDMGALERTPETLVVNTLIDELDGSVVDGDVSLRDALAAAGPGDTIAFSVSGVLKLTKGQLNLTKTLSITGPGAKLLTIDASGNDPTPAEDNGDGSRILEIDDGSAGIVPVAISGLTFTGADYDIADDGNFKGGALFNNENLTLTACEVRGNAVISGYGGGLSSYGPVIVQNCTFAENLAGGGGGVFLSFTALVENTTIANNTSYSTGGGAIVFSADATFRHSTIAGNTALGPEGSGGGGGVSAYGLEAYHVRLYSSVAAGNIGGDLDVIFGNENPFESLGYNAVGFGGGVDVFEQPGDKAYIANPLLGVLADNGGPTRTRLPQPGSAAIGQGDPTASAGSLGTPTFDQRGSGFSRVVGRIDVGAVESTLQPLVVNTLIDELDGSVIDGDVSLRDALAAATPFSLITFSVTGAIKLTLGELTIPDSVYVHSPGASVITVDAQQNSRVFNIPAAAGDVTLVGLTITGGRTTGNDSAGWGGAIRSVSTATLRLMQSVVSNSRTTGAHAHGGGIFSNGDVVVMQSTISGNTTTGLDGKGGGILAVNTTLIQSTVSSNSTVGNYARGGGIHSADLTLNKSTIAGNHTEGNNAEGGGVFAGGDIALHDSTVRDSFTMGYGSIGGGLAASGSISITQSTVASNHTEGTQAEGGGFFSGGAVTLHDATISDNFTLGLGSDGGGLATGSAVAITRSTISGNRIGGNFSYGGGIDVLPLRVSMGVYIFSPLTISESTISGNSIGGENGDGGGIYAAGDVVIDHTTISGNRVEGLFGHGGGIFARQAATITRSTIADNRSLQGMGGGVYQHDIPGDQLLAISGTIIADNMARDGSTNVRVGPNNSLTVHYSLVSNTAGSRITAASGTGNVLNVPALLGPLADNAGPTKTHALLPGSPAINAGDPGVTVNSQVFDQRGAPFLRVVGGRIDMGALESQPIAASGDFDVDMDVDGFDFLSWQRGFGASSPNGTHATGDADYDHDVDATDFAVWRGAFGSSTASAAQEQTLSVGVAPPTLPTDARDAALAALPWNNVTPSRPLFRPRLVRAR